MYIYIHTHIHTRNPTEWCYDSQTLLHQLEPVVRMPKPGGCATKLLNKTLSDFISTIKNSNPTQSPEILVEHPNQSTSFNIELFYMLNQVEPPQD